MISSVVRVNGGCGVVNCDFCARQFRDEMNESEGKISECVDRGFFHGHGVTAETDRCKWTEEPTVETTRRCVNKNAGKS